jgi:hypothetical protein
MLAIYRDGEPRNRIGAGREFRIATPRMAGE